MAILLDAQSRVLIQGITGSQGRVSTADLLAYGTRVVAGVVPERGGESVSGVPVFDTVLEAVESTHANVSLVFVPPHLGADAVYEAMSCGVDLVVWPADPVPLHDISGVLAVMKGSRTRLVGPNTPGIISPGKAKAGFMPSQCYCPGPVGVVTKSGSLSYEICLRLTKAEVGQSTVVGVGGDSLKGTRMKDCLELFRDDSETQMVLLIGEVGGSEEYEVAETVSGGYPKPVVAYIAGRTAPPGKKLGHAGAIIRDREDTCESKVKALREAGIKVVPSLYEVAETVRNTLFRLPGGMNSGL